MPQKHQYTYTSAEVLASALKYQHANDWKRSADIVDRRFYEVAQRRGLLPRATAHMTPQASPYSSDYVVYVFEFTDHHSYVGLTFKPEERYKQHMKSGPVFEHIKICPTFEYKLLVTDLPNPTAAIDSECHWMDTYANDWVPINVAPGGSIGSVRSLWNPRLCFDDAQKYRTRKDWYLGNQTAYTHAHRLGCFDACVAHMPTYDKSQRVWDSPTPEAREKMRVAKLGTVHTDEQKAKIATSVAASWIDRRNEPHPLTGVAKSPEHCAAISAGKLGLKQSEAHRLHNAEAHKGLKIGHYKTRCDKLPDAERIARRAESCRKCREKKALAAAGQSN